MRASFTSRAILAVSLATVLGCSDPGAQPAAPGGTGGTAAAGGAGSGPGAAGDVATAGNSALGGAGAGSGGGSGGAGSSGAGASALGGGGTGGQAGGAPAVFGQLVCAPSDAGNGVHTTTSVEPPEWNPMAGVTPGKLSESKDYESTVYGNGYAFPYRIYTSANYEKGRPALFLVFGDGGMYLGGAYKTPTVLDNLTAEGALPPVVGLFIDPGPDRVGTYDPPSDKYARFLTEEIIPEVILPEYSISRDPDAWATVGYSASGEAGFAVVWHRPEQFHAFFGHSASFGASIRYDGWVWADQIMQAPARDLRVSLVVAAQGDLTDDRGSWRTINEMVAAALEAKGNPYRLIIGPGDHGGLASQQDFPNALRWMWQGCAFAEQP